jgi:UV DNA damage endonuclease
MVRIGYVYPAGKLIKLPQRKLSSEKLSGCGAENLLGIADALEWNSWHGIKLFRMPLDTVPFSPKVSPECWKESLSVEGRVIGDYIRKNQMRIFMHTSPAYCLGSPDPIHLKKAIAEIEHCSALLDLLGLSPSAKIIANIGKFSKRRRDAAKRFISNFSRLSKKAQGRLAVENDDLYWPFYDAFGVAGKLHLPVVFNYPAFLRNRFTELSPQDILNVAAISWKKEDGRQKVHYSENVRGKKKKNTISKKAFRKFYGEVRGLDADIMLHTEEGGRSVLKARELMD